MNSCPTCGTQYTDQTLRYCLQDGTPLTISCAAETPTVLILETETKDRIVNNDSFVTRYGSGHGIEGKNGQRRETGGVGSAVKAAGTIAAIALVAVIGVAGYLLGSRNSVANLNEPVGQKAGSSASNANVTDRPAVANSLPAANTALAPVSPTPFDDTQAKSDLAERVASWKASIESSEADSIAIIYTPTIDNYYGNKRVKSSQLRKAKADKLKAFEELKVDVSDQTIKVDASGKTATVLFDREIWFNGKKDVHNRSRVEMKCRLVDGRWLIYSERDIKTYPNK